MEYGIYSQNRFQKGVAAGVCERSNLSKVAKKKIKGAEWASEG